MELASPMNMPLTMTRFYRVLKTGHCYKKGGSPAILQIHHTGNKAVLNLILDGIPVSESPTALAPLMFYAEGVVSRELTSRNFGNDKRDCYKSPVEHEKYFTFSLTNSIFFAASTLSLKPLFINTT